MNNQDNFQDDFSFEDSDNNGSNEHAESNSNSNGKMSGPVLSDSDPSVPQYFFPVTHDRIFFVPNHKKSDALVTIANFCVWIEKEEVVYDEFGNISRFYTIRGKHESGREIEPFRIDAKEFSEMKWTDTHLGKDCYIYDKPKNKHRVLEAIQRHPHTYIAPTTTVHGYTGWQRTDKGLQYLFPIYSEKKYGKEVCLSDTLSAYYIPPANNEEKVEGLNRSLMFLSVAAPRVTVPLLASIYIAPLASFVDIDFTVWIYGKTGSFKTTLTRHIMHHFGKFDNHVITWNATPNAIERYASIIGDAPLVIDDYAPQPDHFSQIKLDQTVERVIRDAGNNAGRARMRANLSLQHIYRKRGLIIATGEQLPKGQSVLARIYGIALEKGDVNTSELSKAQANNERLYGFATAAYIDWIEQTGEQKLKELFEKAEEKMLNTNLQSNVVDRLRRSAAKLYAAFEVMLQMMMSYGIIEPNEIEKFQEIAITSIAENISAFREEFEDESVVQKIFTTIETMLHTKQAVIVKLEEVDSAQFTVPIIGYYDKDYLYLLWEVTYDQILKYMKSIGSSFTYNKRAAQNAVRSDIGIEGTKVMWIAGKAKRVLPIPIIKLKELEFSFVSEQNQPPPPDF